MIDKARIELAYGKNSFTLRIPGSRVKVVQPESFSEDISGKILLEKAFDHPFESASLEEAVKGKNVCALVEDSTRGQPHREEIEAGARRLRGAHFVQYIITTGSHTPQVKGNWRIRDFIKEIASRCSLNYQVLIHNCEDRAKSVGTTSRGTEVKVDEKALEADLFFVTANMKTHYFAGYCNAVKNFLPGICAFQTIEDNHRLALEEEATFGRHPWHPDLNRRSNSVAEDMIEAMRLVIQGRPIYTLATIGGKEIHWAAFGKIEPVTRAGFAVVDKMSSFRVKPAKYVVVSPGGFPNDETLYTAQRGLDLIKNAILDGGEVLLIAACNGGEQGLAPSEKAKEFFYDSLAAEVPKKELLSQIKKEYRLFKQKAYKMAEIISRTDKIWLYSELDEEIVKRAHLYPTRNPQKVIDEWLSRDESAPIAFFKQANKLAIYRDVG